MSGVDVLCVGDVVTDHALTVLPGPDVATRTAAPGTWLDLRLGAKVPVGSAGMFDAVGNAANAAVACARLGLRTGLVSDVGDDHTGDRTRARLAAEGVDVSTVRRHPGRLTNHHYVLGVGAERTILVRHEDYDSRWPDPAEPRWLYFSSVGEHAAGYERAIVDWLAAHPDVRLAFQPGTLQIRRDAAALAAVYRRSAVLVLNREEAAAVTGGPVGDVAALVGRLHALGPTRVVVTDGPAGAFASDGTSLRWMPVYPDPAPPVERTGAGDAFAATYVAALALGHDDPTALRWAPVNSMSVVRRVGGQAGLLTRPELEDLLDRAPADYRACAAVPS